MWLIFFFLEVVDFYLHLIVERCRKDPNAGFVDAHAFQATFYKLLIESPAEADKTADGVIDNMLIFHFNFLFSESSFLKKID